MKLFGRADIVLIVLVAAVSAAVWLINRSIHSGKAARAEIYYYSELVETIDLGKESERSFSIPQDENVVFFLDGKGNIQFVESDCPDKVCINTGKIRVPGQYAACLPNGIVVKIVSADGEEGEADIIR
ncbi:MAG: NusG domain II-containing protein [Bacillota bacterium]